MSNDATTPPSPEEIAFTQAPYLMRAMHEWLVDHDHTPYIRVDLRHPELVLPPHLRSGEMLILNLSYRAANGLRIGNDVITFNARFNQQAAAIVVPIGAVTAIYSKENMGGMMFKYNPGTATTSPAKAPDPASVPTKRERPSFLKVVE